MTLRKHDYSCRRHQISEYTAVGLGSYRYIRRILHGGGARFNIACFIVLPASSVSASGVCVVDRRGTTTMKSCTDGALLQPPARMPSCRPRDRHVDSPSRTAIVATPSSSSSTEPLLSLASPTAPRGAPQRSPKSPSTAAGGGSSGVQAAHSCPSAASDDDSGCALEEYAWVPPGLSALQVSTSAFFRVNASLIDSISLETCGHPTCISGECRK